VDIIFPVSASFTAVHCVWSCAVSCVLTFALLLILFRSRDNVVGIATGYRLDKRRVGVQVLAGSRSFSSPRCPDRLLGPPNLKSRGYRGNFPRGLNGRGVMLTTHFPLVPRSRKSGFNTHSPIRFHGVVLN
jgi:hypothetical protein